MECLKILEMNTSQFVFLCTADSPTHSLLTRTKCRRVPVTQHKATVLCCSLDLASYLHFQYIPDHALRHTRMHLHFATRVGCLRDLETLPRSDRGKIFIDCVCIISSSDSSIFNTTLCVYQYILRIALRSVTTTDLHSVLFYRKLFP